MPFFGDLRFFDIPLWRIWAHMGAHGNEKKTQIKRKF